jgi:integrase
VAVYVSAVVAYIRKRQGTPYWFACYAGSDGRRVQRSTKETDKRIAQRIADQFEQAARRGRAGLLTEQQARRVIGEIYELVNHEELQTDSIADFFTRWLERVKVESSPKTFQRYGSIVARFLHWLGPKGNLALNHLSHKDLTRYRDHLAARHSPSSVNLSLAAIQAGLSRAFDDGLVDVNEASRVPRLGDDPNRTQERRPFTEEELRAILAVADTEWCGMVLAAAYTGMRLGDVSLLRWENVDLSGRELRFKTEKTGREQVVPIAEPLHRHFLEIAGSDDPRAPLFPRAYATRQRDIPTGTLSNQFYRLMTRAGVVPPRHNKGGGQGRDAARSSIGLGFHCLRHTTTSLLKRAGISDAVAREIVGHESAAVSRIYSHIDARTLRAAIDQLPDITTQS